MRSSWRRPPELRTEFRKPRFFRRSVTAREHPAASPFRRALFESKRQLDAVYEIDIACLAGFHDEVLKAIRSAAKCELRGRALNKEYVRASRDLGAGSLELHLAPDDAGSNPGVSCGIPLYPCSRIDFPHGLGKLGPGLGDLLRSGLAAAREIGLLYAIVHVQ